MVAKRFYAVYSDKMKRNSKLMGYTIINIMNTLLAKKKVVSMGVRSSELVVYHKNMANCRTYAHDIWAC